MNLTPILRRWFPRRRLCKCRRARCPPPLPVCRQCFDASPLTLQHEFAQAVHRNRVELLRITRINLRFLAGGNRPRNPRSIAMITDLTGVDLTGRTVRLRQSFFRAGLNAHDHPFKCQAGNGCSPCALGTKVFGYFINDQEECYIRRSDIEAVIE